MRRSECGHGLKGVRKRKTNICWFDRNNAVLMQMQEQLMTQLQDVVEQDGEEAEEHEQGMEEGGQAEEEEIETDTECEMPAGICDTPRPGFSSK